MPSARTEVHLPALQRRWRLELTATLLLSLSPCLPAQDTAAAPPGPRIQPAAVRAAIRALDDDPNVEHGRKTRQLTWLQPQHRTDPVNYPAATGWSWFATLGEGMRMLLWVAAAFGAGLLVVYVTRLVRLRAGHGGLGRLTLPTYIQDLDIRPQSLPADVGAAAWLLWERGEQRAALALLYRGMLSRLVHVHAAPIRASFTEEECAQAAAQRLTGAALEFVRRLIALWLQAVYGGTAPESEDFRGLCAGLDATLGSPSAPAGART